MTYDPQDYLGSGNAIHAIERCRAAGQKKFSDITGPGGTQYVDLVMEGGGVLGLALVGYTYGLELAGLRFRSIGGTSAGSINALLLGSVAPPNEFRSREVLDIIGPLDMMKFVDGGVDAKVFAKTLSLGSNIAARTVQLGALVPNLDEIMLGKLGINPGKGFLNWLVSIISKHHITTTEDLHNKMNNKPSLKGLGGRPFNAQLKVVATDLSLSRKAVFPEEAHRYWENWENVNPALYVRASMSVPYFFQPMKVKIPGPLGANFRSTISGLKQAPRETTFVDGGILSNFPISLFHRRAGPNDTPTIPRLPTFGVKLGKLPEEANSVKGPLDLLADMFSAARSAADKEFIRNNPDYKELVAWINTNDINWLDFNLSKENQITLFENGLREAARFLENFDWPGYKEIRKDLAG